MRELRIDLLVATVTLVRPFARGQAPELCKLGAATASFFQHNGKRFLVTNRHVLVNEKEGHYPDHLLAQIHANKAKPSLIRDVEIPLYKEGKPLWLEHPTNKAIDLVALEISDLISDSDMIEFWRSERFLPTDIAVDLGTETLVVGYPLGFYDTHHNLPIVRSGTVATTFGAMFRGQPLFLIDAVLHPGTSGSPVVLPRSTVQKTISGDIRMGSFPPYLLGINSGEYSLDGIGLGLNTIWYAGLVLDILNG